MQTIPCNLCNFTEFQIIYPATIKKATNQIFSYNCTSDEHGEYFQVVKCSRCGLVYCNPRVSDAELSKIYSNIQDQIYKEEIEGRIKTFDRSLSNLSNHKTGGTLLDIGCSIGVFLSRAKSRGWEVNGVEPSSWCINEGQNRFNLGNEIKEGTIDTVQTWDRKYDVVTMWDVLEHVNDPLKVLKISRDLLRDDGILAFSTVDIGSLYARFLGKRWPWLMKMHIYYFDKKSIRNYLNKSGFDLVELLATIFSHIIIKTVFETNETKF